MTVQQTHKPAFVEFRQPNLNCRSDPPRPVGQVFQGEFTGGGPQDQLHTLLIPLMGERLQPSPQLGSLAGSQFQSGSLSSHELHSAIFGTETQDARTPQTYIGAPRISRRWATLPL